MTVNIQFLLSVIEAFASYDGPAGACEVLVFSSWILLDIIFHTIAEVQQNILPYHCYMYDRKISVRFVANKV